MLNKTFLFAKDFHEKDHSGHGFDHIQRVYQNAQEILKHEQADHFIVLMAALLHDIDDYKINPNGHQAKDFLESLNLENAIIQKILSTIDAIGFSKSGENPCFETIEEKILSDADKLDGIGALGICRTISYATNKKRPIFDPEHFPDENQTLEQYKAATDPAINHFFDKLLKLKNAMQTETAQKMAQKRHEFMIAFLKEFFAENNAPEWSAYLDGWLDRHQ